MAIGKLEWLQRHFENHFQAIKNELDTNKRIQQCVASLAIATLKVCSLG
jgi:hypothetical protein